MLRAAFVSLGLVALGPFATRLGWVRFPAGLAMVAVGGFVAVVVVLASLVSVARGGVLASNVPALLVACIALAAPVAQLVSAGMPPAIHDISSDTDDPPLFQALLPLRLGNVSPAAYDGPEAAVQQKRAYPDIGPLRLASRVTDTLSRAERAGRALGWNIVSMDPDTGRLEATATTYWFRFVDDIVIRVRQDGAGSRLDIRSKSRVGRGDLGANARRIRRFMALIRGGE